jgi:membrane-associated protein
LSFEELLDQIVTSTGPQALWILFGASMVEYVFPPFPGDTVTLFGAYYSVVGALPIPAVFGAVMAGSVVGSALDYLIGLRLRDLTRSGKAPRWLLRWLSIEKLKKIEENWRRKGDVLILVNRFVPAIRGVFFVAAGMGGIDFRRVMILGAISASLWNALLLGVGYLVGANLERLERFLRTYSAVAWIVVGGIALVLVLRAARRRARSHSKSHEEKT